MFYSLQCHKTKKDSNYIVSSWPCGGLRQKTYFRKMALEHWTTVGWLGRHHWLKQVLRTHTIMAFFSPTYHKMFHHNSVIFPQNGWKLCKCDHKNIYNHRYAPFDTFLDEFEDVSTKNYFFAPKLHIDKSFFYWNIVYMGFFRCSI